MPTAAFALFYNIPKFFELTTEKRSFVQFLNRSEPKLEVGENATASYGTNQTFEVKVKVRNCSLYMYI